MAGGLSAIAQSVLTHHVRDAVRSGQLQPLEDLPATQTLSLDIVLPIHDEAALQAFNRDLYDPSSPNYKHYLKPKEFTARFGPSQAEYDAVVKFAKANGLTITGGDIDRRDVLVVAPVSAIESAFYLRMHRYKHPTEDRVFYAPDREPTTDLEFPLWHVSGLDDYSIPYPMMESREEYAARHGIKTEDVVDHATTGSGPGASFLGSDMRAAYYGNGPLTGAGQNLGLFEFKGTDLDDLDTYFTNAGQTNNVPITLLSVDGASVDCLESATPACDDGEQNLDMTQAIGMAPGLASLTMYIGSKATAIISAMTTHDPLPTTIGCSWGYTPEDSTVINPYLEQMAAQGQNFFSAAGDHSTWMKSGTGESWPSDDPYLVSVGGTDLTTDGAGGPWKTEKAWVDGGGGDSPNLFPIPYWQQYSGVINTANAGSTSYRNGPDVSANANFTFYTCKDQKACQANAYGGTSFAAPMWAAYVALVNQQLVADGQTTIGFLNPTIYSENSSSPSTYAADFHDVTSGTSGSYSATTGYDLVTGWGSPTANLIPTLVASTQTASAITFTTTGPLHTMAPSVSLAATSNSSGAITYSLVSGPATLSGSTLTLTGATGTVVVQANQAMAPYFTAGTKQANLSVLAGSVWLGNAGSKVSTFDLLGNNISSSSGSSGGGLGTIAGPLAMAFDATGNTWIASSTGVSEFTHTASPVASTPFTTGGISNPLALAVDGASHVWIANGNGTVSELADNGTALSPASGFTGSGLSTPGGITVDNSGNVWVSNTSDNSITEIMGAAVPVAPTSTALTNGTEGALP